MASLSLHSILDLSLHSAAKRDSRIEPKDLGWPTCPRCAVPVAPGVRPQLVRPYDLSWRPSNLGSTRLERQISMHTFPTFPQPTLRYGEEMKPLGNRRFIPSYFEDFERFICYVARNSAGVRYGTSAPDSYRASSLCRIEEIRQPSHLFVLATHYTAWDHSDVTPLRDVQYDGCGEVTDPHPNCRLKTRARP